MKLPQKVVEENVVLHLGRHWSPPAQSLNISERLELKALFYQQLLAMILSV